jgi:hypothetical protein
MCLSIPPRVIDEAATVTLRSAASSPEHYPRQGGALVIQVALECGGLVAREGRYSTTLLV